MQPKAILLAILVVLAISLRGAESLPGSPGFMLSHYWSANNTFVDSVGVEPTTGDALHVAFAPGFAGLAFSFDGSVPPNIGVTSGYINLPRVWAIQFHFLIPAAFPGIFAADDNTNYYYPLISRWGTTGGASGVNYGIYLICSKTTGLPLAIQLFRNPVGGPTSTASWSVNLPLNAWHFVDVWDNGTQACAEVNNVQIGCTSSLEIVANTFVPLRFGRHAEETAANPGAFFGLIDEIKFYRIAPSLLPTQTPVASSTRTAAASSKIGPTRIPTTKSSSPSLSASKSRKPTGHGKKPGHKHGGGQHSGKKGVQGGKKPGYKNGGHKSGKKGGHGGLANKGGNGGKGGKGSKGGKGGKGGKK